VIALKASRPDLTIELNGGLDTPEDCLNALKHLDGAMVGRAAYAHPLRWRNIDSLIFGAARRQVLASDVVLGLIPHADRHLQRGGRLWDLCRHLVHIVEAVPGARHWRNNLSTKAQKAGAGIEIIEEAAQQLLDAGL
jgi:tRNA-dihydrouridine synthase A